MSTTDISLHESGDGGQMTIIGDDLLMGETLYLQPYLALFGGNVEDDTRPGILPTEERFDYWANALLFNDSPARQFNSKTERTLRKVVLNSSGRLAVERAVNEDLAYLGNLLTYGVAVEFAGTSKIRIRISFRQKGNQEDKVLQLVYDNAKNELIIDKII